MRREFSKRPVLVRTDASTGIHHGFYVMYHATKKENVSRILTDGFRESTGGMLGPGLYVSRDIDKTRAYGDVCFKLLVYIGITKLMAEVDTSGDWRSHHHSAYLPPNNDVVSSKREETCLKSAQQARILGIAYGFDSSTMDGRARNLEGTNEVLDQWERCLMNLWQLPLEPFSSSHQLFLRPLHLFLPRILCLFLLQLHLAPQSAA